jgi:hypothetical protein
MTRDGWHVEPAPDQRILLRYVGTEAVLIDHQTVSETRAVGFSPSGAALVIATTADITLLTRPT